METWHAAVPTFAPTSTSQYDSLTPSVSPTLAPPSLELQSNWACADHIKSISECFEAGASLKLPLRDPIPNPYYRPGCYYRSLDSLLFFGDSKSSNVQHCNSFLQCVCVKPATRAPTSNPTFAPTTISQYNSLTPTILPTLGPPSFELQRNGECKEHITSGSECLQAAVILKLPLRDTIYGQYLQGCYYRSAGSYSRLYFRPLSSGSPPQRCNNLPNGFQCICKTPATPVPTSNPTIAPTLKDDYDSLTPTFLPTTFAPTSSPSLEPNTCSFDSKTSPLQDNSKKLTNSILRLTEVRVPIDAISVDAVLYPQRVEIKRVPLNRTGGACDGKS